MSPSGSGFGEEKAERAGVSSLWLQHTWAPWGSIWTCFPASSPACVLFLTRWHPSPLCAQPFRFPCRQGCCRVLTGTAGTSGEGVLAEGTAKARSWRDVWPLSAGLPHSCSPCSKRVNTCNKNLAMGDPMGHSLLSWDCGVMVSKLHPFLEPCPLPSALPCRCSACVLRPEG